MKKVHRPIVLIITIVVFLLHNPESVCAQEQDFMVWSKLAIKYDVSKLTRLSLEEEFRFFDNASRLEQNHTELGISHELSKKWEAGAFYRFIYETNPERTYSLSHRGWVQLAYKWGWGNFSGSVRERLQSTFQDYMSSKNGKIPENYLRSKLSFSYKPTTGKIEPYAGGEFWYALGEKNQYFIDKIRIGAGLEYRRSRNVRWRVFYNYQHEIQVTYPKTGNILGISYTYLFR